MEYYIHLKLIKNVDKFSVYFVMFYVKSQQLETKCFYLKDIQKDILYNYFGNFDSHLSLCDKIITLPITKPILTDSSIT